MTAVPLSFALSPEHEHVEWTARTLQALGYPLNWQADRTGFHLDLILADDAIPAEAVAAIDRLARTVGDAAPTMHDGITPAEAMHAATEAHANGWFPPSAYDEDRILITRALPGHPHAIADDECVRTVMRVELAVAVVLGDTVTRDRMTRELAGVCDLSKATENDLRNIERQTERTRAKHLLRARDEGYVQRARDLRDLLDTYHLDGRDSAEFVLEHGWRGIRHLPRDHPAKVQYLARLRQGQKVAA